jgi:hypothetical protein
MTRTRTPSNQGVHLPAASRLQVTPSVLWIGVHIHAVEL